MRYRLADHGLVFSTRDRGARMLADLREKAGEAAIPSVVIDFAEVKSVSYSFIDEFIGELFAAADQDQLPTLANVPPAAARTIERSLQRRGVDLEPALDGSLETA